MLSFFTASLGICPHMIQPPWDSLSCFLLLLCHLALFVIEVLIHTVLILFCVSLKTHTNILEFLITDYNIRTHCRHLPRLGMGLT